MHVLQSLFYLTTGLHVSGATVTHLQEHKTTLTTASGNRLSLFIFNLRTAAFKAHCAIWVRRCNFRHHASPCVSPRESTQRRKVELWTRNVR